MRTYKNILAALIILLGSFAFSIFFTNKGNIGYVIFIAIISIFLFNIIVRNLILFKPYFLSKWNIFSSKFRKDFEFDIPKELAFDKLLEVIAASPLRLKYADKNKLEMLATSKMSWMSWGENIYIDLVDSGNHTILKFVSVAFFQMYTWGKNEDNFNIFLQKIEDSLTV